MPVKDIFYKQIKDEIATWPAKDICAISFFIESNEFKAYGGHTNLTDFFISYNTEQECDGTGPFDEERWNYAFWPQIETAIVDTYEGNEGAQLLLNWYKEQGIQNIGYEAPWNSQDEKANIGPVGYSELVMIGAGIAKRLQEEGVIEKIFGRRLPIIIHDLEYGWQSLEATRIANPHGQAKDFFTWIENI